MVDNFTKFGWKSSDQPHSNSYLLPKVIALLEEVNAKRVADIGSGNGALCSILHDDGFSVVGVEIDSDGVEIAKKSQPNINFYCQGVQDDPLEIVNKEGTFDTVISTEVIEHLFSPKMLPIYANNLLNEHGYFIISTPYHGFLKNLMLSLANKWDFHFHTWDDGGHIKFFSKKTLYKILQENGFTCIKFIGAGRLPFLWKSMIVLAKKNPS